MLCCIYSPSCYPEIKATSWGASAPGLVLLSQHSSDNLARHYMQLWLVQDQAAQDSIANITGAEEPRHGGVVTQGATVQWLPWLQISCGKMDVSICVKCGEARCSVVVIGKTTS